MFKYIIKRIIVFIPTLIIVSLLTFIISLKAPGDPVELMMGASAEGNQNADKQATEKTYNETRKKLGLDLPIFYCSLSTAAESDTLYKISKQSHQQTLERLTHQCGSWELVQPYYVATKNLETSIYTLATDSINGNELIILKNSVNNLFLNYQRPEIEKSIDTLQSLTLLLQNKYKTATTTDTTAQLNTNPVTAQLNAITNDNEKVKTLYNNILNSKSGYKNYIPALHWYGLNNQYHRWASGFVTGNLGYSYQDKRPITTAAAQSLKWTIIISFISILITYLVAIPLGVASAVQRGTKKDRIITTILFILYSLPNFWIATLLIKYFGGGDYLSWFPPYGLGEVADNDSWLTAFKVRSYHLILPLICWTYANFAFLSRQMRGGMLSVLQQDYIRTARAKGLPENKIIWKHAFRNSLLPIITLFANVFPLLVGGAVVLEVIFTIPGMGKWAFDAIQHRDYPIIFAVMMLSTILTMVGYLVADILYAIVDPRISFDNKK